VAATVVIGAGLIAAINISYELYMVRPEDRVVRRGWSHVLPGMSERDVVGLLANLMTVAKCSTWGSAKDTRMRILELRRVDRRTT
jgi:hypothetical protein